MRLHTAKGFGLGLLVCICMVSLLLAFGCNGSSSTGKKAQPCANTNECPMNTVCTSEGCKAPQACVSHEDCNACNVCDATIDPKACTYDSSACTECAREADCPAGYTCYLPATGKGHCIPGKIDGDADTGCDPTDAKACSGIDMSCPNDFSQKCDAASKACVCKYKSCKDDTGCASTEVCDKEKNYCVAKPAVDGDPEVEIEKEIEQEVSTCTGGAAACQRSGDCDSGKVCIGGCCAAGCTATSCTNGTICNTNNGYCEYCGKDGEELCAAGRCCNYAASETAGSSGFWYCGSCCVPACKGDETCVGSVCQKMVCPADCGADKCCDSTHGFACYDCPDGDADIEYRSSTCLGANASCKDGVDACCSGTCLMGTCL